MHIPVDVGVPVVTDRLTLHFAPALYDDGVWNRHAVTVAPLVREAVARIHPRDASALAVASGGSVVVAERFELPVVVDPEVAIGSITVPFNHPATRGMAATPAVSVDPVRGGR